MLFTLIGVLFLIFCTCLLVCACVGVRRSAVRSAARPRLRRTGSVAALWARQVALDHTCWPRKFTKFTLFYVHACVHNMMGPKLRICLVCLPFSLIKPGLFNLCWVALLVAFTLGYGWLMMRQMLHLFYFMFSWLMLLSKIICFNRNMENHPRKPYNNNTIWLWSWLIN